MNDWITKETNIIEIQSLISSGYEIEVDSPDGFVPVSQFVDKGDWEEYVLTTNNGLTVRCNENHLFQTQAGWERAIDLIDINSVFLTTSGWETGIVRKTNQTIPIVDIQVDHENHRYYTNGVSSHNTGVGKSLFMCHMSANAISQGKNVLYITLEMSEERIAERIDANLMNLPIGQLKDLSKQMFEDRISKINAKIQGRLIVKEYPTASAHSGHFKALINELKLKRNFSPDILFIDYLNICSSSRFKSGSNQNSYTIIKSIAEELRGLAVEEDLPIVTATQTTRSGFCLDLATMVVTRSGVKTISDIVVGDEVLSNSGWNTVKTVFPTVKKKMYRITTESGKEIVCSADHLFPTEDGEKNIKSGLCLEDKLFINKSDV